MTTNNFFKSYIHYSIYFICAIFYAFAVDISFPDDGLRHIAFSFNKDIMISWGNVYPNSLFTNYDPWFGWHYLLHILMIIVPYEKIHILINSISLFCLSILIHKHIRMYSKYDFSSLLYIIVFIITMLTSFRYVMLRPDLLSGLYVMFVLLLSNRFLLIFITTILFIPFYYLFFLYTGAIGLVYLIQKKFKAFWGVFIASFFGLGFHLLYNFDGYLDTVLNILTDQKLRMGLAVKEGVPLFDILDGINYYVLVGVFLTVSFSLIYFKYNYFKSNSLSLFLLITSILWVNQYRYFHLFLPLITIFIFVSISNMNKKAFFYSLRKYFVIGKRYFNFSKNKKLFYIIAIPYSILMLSYIFSSQSLNKEVEEGKYFENKKFENKTILSNKMDSDMFKAHYYNPTLKLIPSCSIGWFDDKNIEMKRIYIKLQNSQKQISENELKKLIDYTNTDYYLHYFGNSKKLNFNKLTSLGIIAKEMDEKKILFVINKEKK